MFPRSVRERVRQAAVLSALASLAALAPAAPAHAATPTYTCDDIEGTVNAGPGSGVTNCATSNGAPASGTITTAFTIVRRSDNLTLTCTPVNGTAGLAATPALVLGNSCTES